MAGPAQQPDETRVTDLLERAVAGDSRAADELLPLVYEQLRSIAAQRMASERAGHTLQATALVHEAYLRLVATDIAWTGRSHFYRAAAESIRRILLDHARKKGRVKRSGGRRRVELGTAELAVDADPAETLAFDEALRRLEEEAADAAAIVKLRYFAGLSIDETALALGLSPRSVDRGWAFARAFLFRQLE